MTRRTLQRAVDGRMTPAERAAWRTGEKGRLAADVYLTRPVSFRNEVWKLDHKNLPILVLPPRGPGVCPWLTTVIDDGTRTLLGWAIALTPHTGTVLTALRRRWCTTRRLARSVRRRPATASTAGWTSPPRRSAT